MMLKAFVSVLDRDEVSTALVGSCLEHNVLR